MPLRVPAVLLWARQWWARDRVEALRQAYTKGFEGNGMLLADLAALCHATDTTMERLDGGGIDPCTISFNEGKRAVFLHIMAMTGLQPADVTQALDIMDRKPEEVDLDGRSDGD